MLQRIAAFLFWVYNLKFDTKINGGPVNSRLPMFYLHVVSRSDLTK